jgi:myosin heavy subunit
MAQDSIHKIITIEIEYSKLIKSWAEAQKVIDETRQSIKNLKKEDADYYEKMAQYKAVIRDNTDAQRQYMKQINEQVKKEAQLDGSVNKLRSDISKLAKEYYALSEADRKSAKGMKMAEQVRNMQTEVNKAEQDLLNFRSNVGNYASALSPLSFQVQQVARELPSLTMSAQQFFLAISNNLPMLADELKRASANNKALRAEGKMTIPVFRQVISSIFSWQTALVVGITLLTVFGKEIGTWVKGLFSAGDALSDVAQYTQDLNRAIENSRSELKREFDALREAKKGTAEYAAARKVIEDKYEGYLSNQKEEIRNLEDQKAAYDALASSITAAAIAKGLEESNANASEEYGEAMDKAFEGVQDKFIKKFGREAGIAYFTEFRAGLNSEIPELKERAQEIYALFEDAPDGMNIIDTWREIFTGQKIGSTSHNELESTLNKVRGATDRYNETLSANKTAMKTLMDMHKISADDINAQGEAIKDLIKQKEQELADINKEIATTEDEIISRNKRAEAVENEIKRLKELGRTNEKAQEAANKIARQAAKTQLDLEKQLSKSIFELRQASLEKDLELSRLRFSWERQELETKLKYDKTLTAESREAINQLILNMEERRYKEESEIRQRWSDKEFEEEARNAENRIKMRFNAQNKLQTIRQKEAQLPNYDILHTSDPNKDIEKNAAKMNIAQQQMDAAQNKLSEIQSMSEETYTALYGGVLEWRNAELDAQKAVAEAKQQVNDIQLQGIKLQEKETQMSIQSAQQMVGALEELAEAAGADAGVVAMLAIAESAAAMGAALHKAFSSSATVWDGIAGAVAAISTITTIITQIKSLNSSAEEERSKYRYASGGLVTGPGTGTSDSIPAMLSNGEAVMTAQAVNDWGAMLSAMNVASGGNAIQVSNLPQRNDGMKGMERMMERALMNMPAPIVSVVDINKGQKRVKVQNSLGKLGRKKYE